MSHLDSAAPPANASKIDCAKQRDGKGCFIEGNNGGPGNPFGRRVADLRQAMLDTMTKSDLAEIMQAMIAKAKKGNVQAAKLVLSYSIGQPEKTHDPDRVNIEEWDIHRETAKMAPELPKVMLQPPAYIPLHVASVTRNAVGLMHEHQLNDFFEKELARTTTGEPAQRAASREPSINGKTDELPPGMAEFYDKLVERGFAAPWPGGKGGPGGAGLTIGKADLPTRRASEEPGRDHVPGLCAEQ